MARSLLIGGVVLVVIGIALYAWQLQSSLHPVLIDAWRLPSGLVFIAEDPQHPRLQEYRRHEQLDQVVQTQPTDFLKILALAQWASRQFKATQPSPLYPPWDARVILDWIRRGKTGGYCAQYAFVFGQACQSFGYFPRYLDIASSGDLGGHFTTEVYVPSLKRWVVFEPEWGTYYTDEGGRLLDALALHQFAVGKSKGRVLEIPRSPHAAGWVRLFYYFRYYLRNNYLSVPVFAKVLPNQQIVFAPYRLAWIDSFTDNAHNWHKAFLSSDPGDFRHALDSTDAPPVECRSGADFLRTVASQPPFRIGRFFIAQKNLVRLVRENLTGDPSFFPLTAESAQHLP